MGRDLGSAGSCGRARWRTQSRTWRTACRWGASRSGGLAKGRPGRRQRMGIEERTRPRRCREAARALGDTVQQVRSSGTAWRGGRLPGRAAARLRATSLATRGRIFDLLAAIRTGRGQRPGRCHRGEAHAVWVANTKILAHLGVGHRVIVAIPKQDVGVCPPRRRQSWTGKSSSGKGSNQGASWARPRHRLGPVLGAAALGGQALAPTQGRRC